MTTIVWYSRDLRISDHAPLFEATNSREKVLPLYIYTDSQEKWPLGEGQSWWLPQSLKNLEESLQSIGLNLCLRKGDYLDVLRKLGQETGSKKLFFHKRYEPYFHKIQEKIGKTLTKEGWEVKSFQGHLLIEPEEVKPYLVFTPYYKHVLARGIDVREAPSPKKSESPKITSLGIEPSPFKFTNEWRPGEKGAFRFFKGFLKDEHSSYAENRDIPSIHGSSGLSPHIAFGEISPRTLWNAIDKKGSSPDPFLRQLIWREFAYHLLWNHPETDTKPLREEYEKFPWNFDENLFEKWTQGKTGYPLVDAGMRQLQQSGWMHNRVRMVVGSFLVKDLLIPWQKGADWFWKLLMDADLANNTFGWQWVGGCGADAAPYFRVFNPTLQSEKFDPEGIYIKRWCPELKHLSPKEIHQPRNPIIDHQGAKERALEAWNKIKK